jgi:hypothetical protein
MTRVIFPAMISRYETLGLDVAPEPPDSEVDLFTNQPNSGGNAAEEEDNIRCVPSAHSSFSRLRLVSC